MVQFLLKLLLKQISCFVPQFPLILTAKFHSLYINPFETYFKHFDFELFFMGKASFS